MGDDLDLYVCAYLCGGPDRVARTAIVALCESGRISVGDKPPYRVTRGEGYAVHPVERAALQGIPGSGLPLRLLLRTTAGASAVEKCAAPLLAEMLLKRSFRGWVRPTPEGDELCRLLADPGEDKSADPGEDKSDEPGEDKSDEPGEDKSAEPADDAGEADAVEADRDEADQDEPGDEADRDEGDRDEGDQDEGDELDWNETAAGFAVRGPDALPDGALRTALEALPDEAGFPIKLARKPTGKQYEDVGGGYGPPQRDD